MKKRPLARPFSLWLTRQLRSALARFALAVRVPEPLPLAMEPPPELVAPALEPEFIEPEAPVLPAVVAAALPAVEPVAAAPPEVVPPVAAPAVPPPGVPVVPIGVPWVLRWPAPTAGSVAGRGGVPWAIARLTVAAATVAAAMILKVDIVQDSFVVWDTLCRR